MSQENHYDHFNYVGPDRDEDRMKQLIDSEPPRVEGKHRFMAGTCVDCGHPLDEICTANLHLPRRQP